MNIQARSVGMALFMNTHSMYPYTCRDQALGPGCLMYYRVFHFCSNEFCRHTAGWLTGEESHGVLMNWLWLWQNGTRLLQCCGFYNIDYLLTGRWIHEVTLRKPTSFTNSPNTAKCHSTIWRIAGRWRIYHYEAWWGLYIKWLCWWIIHCIMKHSLDL